GRNAPWWPTGRRLEGSGRPGQYRLVVSPRPRVSFRAAGYGFQDTLAPVLRRLGLDVCDPRDSFAGRVDAAALFIPDKHLSAAGNQILLAALLAHLRRGEPESESVPSPPAPAGPTGAGRKEVRKP